MKSPATNTSLRTIGGDAVPFVAWFGPEKSRAVVWIVAATCFPLLSLRAQPTAATFRQLISSPPIIEEIVAERRYEGTKPTDFYFGRWQTNAFLLSVLTNLPNIERGGGAGDLTDVRAYFDDQAWTVFGANRPLKIGSLNTISPSNELVVALHWASFDLGRLLNAGIEHLKPRQVIWTSDLTFIGTNDANPIVVSGTLKTNSSGG